LTEDVDVGVVSTLWLVCGTTQGKSRLHTTTLVRPAVSWRHIVVKVVGSVFSVEIRHTLNICSLFYFNVMTIHSRWY